MRDLRGCPQPKIMFGMLQIILRCDSIAPDMSIVRQLKVSFRHLLRIAAYF
jgi:hypothetical protein